MSLIFDIETSALPLAQLEPLFLATYQPPPHPGEFDESTVRYGNAKKPESRAPILEAAREAHALAVSGYELAVQVDRAAKFAEMLDKAALSPVTGCVLAVGVRSLRDGKCNIIGSKPEEQDEQVILETCWMNFGKWRSQERKLIGHNILGFDLPFLIRRSWILGVDVPKWVRDGRYFDRCFVDTLELWLCGQRVGSCEASLGVVGQAFGLGGKTEGMDGGDFARLWNGSAEEREQAKQYLLRDLELTANVAQRMGCV